MNQLSDLTFDSLDTGVSAEEIDAYITKIGSKRYFTKQRSIFAYTVLSGIFIVMILSLWAVGMTTIIVYSVGFIVVLLILTGVMYAEKRTYEQYVRMRRFAQSNGFTITEKGAFDDNMKPGMIFDNGHSRKTHGGYVLNDGTLIENYQYTTGSGKHRQTHNYAYVEIPLARNLPHMVLDAKSNNFMKIFSGLPDEFNTSQTLSLEGNFDQFFTLYAPREYEADALYVFTPDVMAVLIDECKDYDIEIVDDKLYLYRNTHFKLDGSDEMKSILKVVDVLRHELHTQTGRYADDNVRLSRHTNVVADKGRRLKKGYRTTVVMAILAVLYVVFEVLL